MKFLYDRSERAAGLDKIFEADLSGFGLLGLVSLMYRVMPDFPV